MAHDINKKSRTEDVLQNFDIDFSIFCLSDPILKGLTKAGYKKPSPVQYEAIPIGRFGADLLVQAKSGTGKTLVYAIVALDMLKRKIQQPQVLILVPTREIALQICELIKRIGAYFPQLTCESFIGGTDIHQDIFKAFNAQIVVGTLGRIIHLISNKGLITELIRLVVVDEADVLFMDKPQEIKCIFEALPKEKQVIASSATFPPDFKEIINMFLRNPHVVKFDSTKLALLGIVHYVKMIELSFLPLKEYHLRLEALETILNRINFAQCIIFCNGIGRVETLCNDIKKWGFSTTFISRWRSQEERTNAIECLRRFRCKVLVSSDVTSRGIDSEYVDLIINFNVSKNGDTYLHRSGRAGRYGSTGVAISIADSKDLEKFKYIEKKANFKCYKLPDPVPVDLIKNPVLDSYAIEDTQEDSSEATEDKYAESSTKSIKKDDNHLIDNIKSEANTVSSQEILDVTTVIKASGLAEQPKPDTFEKYNPILENDFVHDSNRKIFHETLATQEDLSEETEDKFAESSTKIIKSGENYLIDNSKNISSNIRSEANSVSSPKIIDVTTAVKAFGFTEQPKSDTYEKYNPIPDAFKPPKQKVKAFYEEIIEEFDSDEESEDAESDFATSSSDSNPRHSFPYSGKKKLADTRRTHLVHSPTYSKKDKQHTNITSSKVPLRPPKNEVKPRHLSHKSLNYEHISSVTSSKIALRPPKDQVKPHHLHHNCLNHKHINDLENASKSVHHSSSSKCTQHCSKKKQRIVDRVENKCCSLNSGQRSPVCYMPSNHRCHSYNSDTTCHSHHNCLHHGHINHFDNSGLLNLCQQPNHSGQSDAYQCIHHSIGSKCRLHNSKKKQRNVDRVENKKCHTLNNEHSPACCMPSNHRCYLYDTTTCCNHRGPELFIPNFEWYHQYHRTLLYYFFGY